MFRFAVLVLAGIGLGALIFGPHGASVGLWFLALIPLFILVKIAFFGMLFGAFARRGGYEWKRETSRSQWPWDRPVRARRDRDERSDADRFEEWHRMAHARDEVDGWAPKPE